MATPQELIDQWPPKLEAKKDQLAQVGAVYAFKVEGDGGGSWLLNLKDNPGVTKGEGAADCTIEMAASDFVDMMEGRSQPQQLFFVGKLKIDGDMGLAMKLQGLMDVLK